MTTVKVRLLKAYLGVRESGQTTFHFHQKGEILEGTLAGPMHANGFKATGENTVINLSFFETLQSEETWLPSPPPKPGVYRTKLAQNPELGEFYSKWDGKHWYVDTKNSAERAQEQLTYSAHQNRLYLADNAHSPAPTIPTKKGKSLADEIIGMFSFLEE